MSEKLEYSDFYKFVTSIGVGLIILAFAVPWAFLREQFDLKVTAEAMQKLPSQSSLIIQQRLYIDSLIFKLLPRVCISLFVIGSIFLIVGSVLWFLRQLWRDRAENAATKKAEEEIKPMTADQVKAKADVETALDTGLGINKEPELDPSFPVVFQEVMASAAQTGSSSYMETERKVSRFLESQLYKTHSVLSHQRIGASEFDFILQSHSHRETDIVIELKVRSSMPKFVWWLDSARRAAIGAQAYASATRRNAKPLLLILVTGSPKLVDQMATYLPKIGDIDISLKQVEVLVMRDQDFFDSDPEDLLRHFRFYV